MFSRYNYLSEKNIDEQLDPSPAPVVVTPTSSKAKAVETTSNLPPPTSSRAKAAETTSTPPPPTLQLPFKFHILLELFRAVETVASILHNRKETITFLKLKPGVQELMRKTALQEKHLGQMLHVFPDCYKLSQDKFKKSSHESSYQLCLTVNLAATSNVHDTLSSTVISERRRIFHRNLIKICHEHHAVSSYFLTNYYALASPSLSNARKYFFKSISNL